MKYCVPFVFLLACGGEKGEDCDEPGPMPVDVSVFAPDGTPVADSPVELDGEACEANGDGTYACVALSDGAGQLSIVDTRYDAYSIFLQLPEFECENEPYVHEAQLEAMMGS